MMLLLKLVLRQSLVLSRNSKLFKFKNAKYNIFKHMLGNLWCYLILLCTPSLYYANETVIDSTYNLPKNIKPNRYNLTMEPNLQVFGNTSTYTGSVIIEFEVLEATNNITLHSRNISINHSLIEIVNSEGLHISNFDIIIDEQREFYVIYLEDTLSEGQSYKLFINEFSGNLTYDNIGFYLAKYKDAEGEVRHVAVTDFEPTDARKAFPCFDQPNMKAKFIINLIRPEGYTSVSNEALASTRDLGDGRFLDTFKETCIMATYTVAFMVTDFKHTTQIERHRVFARVDAINSGMANYALSIGIRTLQVLEEFTGINYTNSKMDQVAIPDNHFNDEAMENWGLVTFSEKHLLMSNETSKTEDIQRCTTYIAHEFAHQWFGNLVTFKDWRYLWLSEGFGAYFQYYIASLVKPEWRLMDQFVVSVMHQVYQVDAESDSEAMNNFQPKAIGSIPSPWICYYKASSVIRMAHHFLTNRIFRRGLHIYLEKNKFKSVEPLDLYEALQTAVDEANAQPLLGNNSVLSVMQTWDSNEGYPLVTAIRDYQTGHIVLSQHRYYRSKDIVSSNLWYIPISYVFQHDTDKNFSDTTANFWFTDRNASITDNVCTAGWFLINKQQTGYYQVNYDITNWNRLATFLNTEDFQVIHPVNRAQLIYDAFHFARTEDLPYEIPLNLTKYLIRETDMIPIAPFVDALRFLNFVMRSSKIYDVFQNYVISLLSAAYEYLGIEEKPLDTQLEKLTRMDVVNWMCNSGHSGCRNDALRKLREWKRTGTLTLSPDLEAIVLCSGMRLASVDDWNYVYEKARNSVGKQRDMFFKALACSENPDILQRFIDNLMESSLLETSEGGRAFHHIVSSSSVGLRVGFEYLKSSNISKSLKSMFAYYVSGRCTTQEQLKEFEHLNSTHNGEFNEAVIDVLDNLNVINATKKEDIEKWLLEYNKENIESSNVV